MIFLYESEIEMLSPEAQDFLIAATNLADEHLVSLVPENARRLFCHLWGDRIDDDEEQQVVDCFAELAVMFPQLDRELVAGMALSIENAKHFQLAAHISALADVAARDLEDLHVYAVETFRVASRHAHILSGPQVEILALLAKLATDVAVPQTMTSAPRWWRTIRKALSKVSRSSLKARCRRKFRWFSSIP